MARIYALYGNPVAHSLSPAFQQAGLDRLGVDAAYELRRVEAAGLTAAAQQLRVGGIAGANITVPYKRLAVDLADLASPVAHSVGAANTWCVREGQLAAFNTDAGGLRVALELLGLSASKRAVVLGSGGAANAAAFALAGTSVAVIARDISAAAAVYTESQALRRCALWGSSAASSLLREADLIVDATSLAHSPLATAEAAYASLGLGVVSSSAAVYSLSYGLGLAPLRAALGPRVALHDGLSMLLLQGALSLRLWTGEHPPISEMCKALQTAAQRPLTWSDQLDGPEREAHVIALLENVAV
ncbi:MAG: shikimate dehydrogenase [Bradymonadia bacterium]|jgi:shikimate dehydrogenase